MSAELDINGPDGNTNGDKTIRLSILVILEQKLLFQSLQLLCISQVEDKSQEKWDEKDPLLHLSQCLLVATLISQTDFPSSFILSQWSWLRHFPWPLKTTESSSIDSKCYHTCFNVSKQGEVTMKNKSIDHIYLMLFPACALHSSILRIIFRPPSMLLSIWPHPLVTRKVAGVWIMRLSRSLLPGWHFRWRSSHFTCSSSTIRHATNFDFC